MKNKIIFTKEAPLPIGPYSQAIETDNGTIYISGQLPVDPKTNVIIEGDIEKQTLQTLNNLKNILIASNKSLNNVIKATVLLIDINDFPIVNKVYEDFFGKIKPARSTFQVSALPKNAKIEIEIIAK